MSLSTNETLMEALADLPPDQLREVVSRANFLLDPVSSGGKPAGDPAGDADQQLVVHEIEALLSQAGDRRALPLSVLMNSAAGKPFRQGVPLFMGFIREYFAPARKVQTVRIVRVLLGCIAQDLTRRSAPVCPRTVCQSLARVASIVDQSFPGYREAGLLPFLLKTKAPA